MSWLSNESKVETTWLMARSLFLGKAVALSCAGLLFASC